ncbi:MAG: ATP-dependent DNA helicase [Oscillospiraceae bacterium]|nr:ATP-dependent DNA helicase [Oscillospiraceae bacterium]
MEPIKLSIRKIVELTLRGGDIDNRFVESGVMQKGAKAHRKLQKSMGKNYKSEVNLSMETEINGIPVLISGRADGVITHSDGSITVDEIKTTTLELSRLYAQRGQHEGQAKCYAMMLCSGMTVKPPKITVQLTYYQLETGELERFSTDYSLDDIIKYFNELINKYSELFRFEFEWAKIRNNSAREMAFPFDAYRKGQREMAVAAYRAIEKGKKLYAQAPTGIGKTLAVLFPAVKAVGEGKAGKLFYLTAKTVTRAVAEDAMRLLMENKLRLKTVSLRAKEKICTNDNINCNPVNCRYARGHYDRVNGAILDLIENNDLITPDVILEYCEKHRVCPFETALDLTLWVDLIVCDYNHVFDPVVYLKRFFTEPGDYVFLIDEAHNLADRVRDMYTASLRKSDLSALKSEIKDKTKVAAGVRRSITAVNKRLNALREALHDKREVTGDTQDELLAEAVYKLTQACDEWLAEERNTQHPLQENLLKVYFGALEYLNISELFDERYAAITEAFGRDMKYTLFCLDPSRIIEKRLSLAKSGIIFSATLTPLPYHREILGGDELDGMIALNSPFDSEKLMLIAHRGISTKYVDRPKSLTPVAEAIYAAVSKKRGNYMAYFPSFEYLSQVSEVFTSRFPDIATIIQDRQMDEDSRVNFLKNFDAENTETLVGFCVMGGIFSEGIDLKGERLIGSVIVGVGLPKISLRQDLIRDYFDGATNGWGYDYAYVFPGMNKVLQAAGRVIRSEDDYGLVLLIDCRFGTEKYKAMYPKFWSHMRMIDTTKELKTALEDFQ